MQELPNHIWLNIIGYLPRRINPVSVFFKDAMSKAKEDIYDEFQLSMKYCLRSDKMKYRMFPDCCGQFYNDCGCVCRTCDGEYKHCRCTVGNR